MTAREALATAEQRLAAAGIDSPRVDAELLLAHVLGTTRSGVYADLDREVDGSLEPLLSRREQREPLAYVLGDWDFRRLTLKTDARALVPRPETEVVVERCLALLADVRAPRVVDIGTGTGAVALSIAHERPDALVTATDISPDALALAQENAQANGLAVAFVESDLLAAVEGSFDLVVSNPPYVVAAELEELEPEVRDWEPRGALLDEGQTARLAVEARACLDGWLELEVHAEHAEDVASTLTSLGYEGATVCRDLASRERMVEAWWRPT